MAVGLISQGVGIGFLLQALAGQLVLALRVPAVVCLTAEGYHAIAVPLCFEQAGCLLIIHPTGLTALSCQVLSMGLPRRVMMSMNSTPCSSQASLGNHGVDGCEARALLQDVGYLIPTPVVGWHTVSGRRHFQGPHKSKATKPGRCIGPIDGAQVWLDQLQVVASTIEGHHWHTLHPLFQGPLRFSQGMRSCAWTKH